MSVCVRQWERVASLYDECNHRNSVGFVDAYMQLQHGQRQQETNVAGFPEKYCLVHIVEI